jgi:HEAT repeat protein
MAKARPVETALAQLAALKGMGPGVLAEELPKYLNNKANIVVAKAADLARSGNIESLTPLLVSAFNRFMEKPAATDPTCAAKREIANALYELGASEQEVFLAGIRHVQKEPAWGGSVDTAAELRGICALGLVRMGYADMMVELVDLLNDAEHQARIMAARAIAYAGRDEGALLLRLKILTGDCEDVVTAETILALGNLARRRALPFIRKYLDDPNPTLAEAAALAIGEMRDAGALEVLTDRWARYPLPESREALALPIALSRLPRSVEFLLSAVSGEAEPVTITSAEALAIYRHDTSIAAKVRAAVEGRSLGRLTDAFRHAFDGG